MLVLFDLVAVADDRYALTVKLEARPVGGDRRGQQCPRLLRGKWLVVEVLYSETFDLGVDLQRPISGLTDDDLLRGC